MALPPHSPVVLLAAVVWSGVGFFVWLFRDAPGARPLAAFMLAASVWSLAEGLSLVSSGLAAKVLWTKVMMTVSPIIPVAWFATALAYTGRDTRLADRRLWLLAVEPAAFVPLVWTNGAHGLVWESVSTVAVDGYVVLTQTYGVAFLAHAAYSYALIAAGALLLVRSNFRTSGHFRSQNTVLLVAIFVPLVANTLSLFRVFPPEYDLTSVGFVLSGLIIAGALYNWNLMEVTPATRELGREVLVDELEDRVLILDDSDCVVDVNPAGAALFDADTDAVVGRALEELEPDLADAVADVGTGGTSLELASGEGLRYFDVRITRLYREGSVAGRLVSLRDVTERQNREQRLDVLNRLLRHNIRNEMNVVRGNVELLIDDLDDLDETALDRLVRVRDTVDTVVDRSDKVGRLSRLMDAESGSGPVELSEACTTIAESVSRAHPGAVVETDVDPHVTVEAGPSIRFAIEELLNNALEHNDSERPRVTLSLSERNEGFVNVEVTDNGPGIPEQEQAVIEAGHETDLKHGSGVGLWLVSWTVRASGGRLDFQNHDGAGDDASGCTISLTLPAAETVPKAPVESSQ